MIDRLLQRAIERVLLIGLLIAEALQGRKPKPPASNIIQPDEADLILQTAFPGDEWDQIERRAIDESD